MLWLTVLCFCYTYDIYDMIFIISFLKSDINNICHQGQNPPPPMKNFGFSSGQGFELKYAHSS